MDRLDQHLSVAIVADGLARGVDAATERGLRHDPPIPNGIEQFVLADDAVAVVDQVQQQIIDLRLHMHDFARAAQFLAAQVDLMAGENKAHGLFPSMLAVADLGQGAAALVLRRRDPAYAAAAKMRLSPAGLGDGTPIECMVSSVAAPSATSRLRSSAIFGFSIVSGRASR